MRQQEITIQQLQPFAQHLEREERSAGTVEKYLRDVRRFFLWLDGKEVNRAALSGWKRHLQQQHYAPATINSMLAAVNAFLRYLGREDCRVRLLRIQRQIFRARERELTRREYDQLVLTARRSGQKRLALVLETVCATGIRISELRYITVEAARYGRAEISLKGKIRVILLPGKLCRKLRQYAKKQRTASGEIFLTRSGGGLGRKQVWAEMKRLCEKAGVAPSKVFPHNLRHLFARTFYRLYRDVARLADMLGHSSMETTRLYLLSTGEEHAKLLEQMRLIL